MDIFTPRKRSEVMSAVKGVGNRSTEQALASALRDHGVKGWRRHRRISVGQTRVRPDFVFMATRVVVFTHGCFWHACPVHGTRPTTRRKYWDRKLDTNRQRDRRISRLLRRDGWRVVEIWEHSLKQDIKRCVRRIAVAVGKGTLAGGRGCTLRPPSPASRRVAR
jgi:DNA mismatch endonuclease (patch repair protein)